MYVGKGSLVCSNNFVIAPVGNVEFCDVKMKSRYYLKFSKRHPRYM